MASVEDNDWRGEMTLLERQKFMYNGKYACDVTFVVGEKSEKVYAHQFILISGSVVFEQKLRKLNEREKQEIRVEGFTVETFEEIIKYLYCEEIELMGTNVSDILAAAEHYRIVPLINECLGYIKKSVTVDNVLEVLNKSFQHQTATITETCMEVISAHASQIFHLDDLSGLHKDALRLILEQDELQDVTEMEVFDFTIKWATDKCTKEGRGTSTEDKREVLGDLIHYIRFASMTTNDFTKVMKKCKVLSASERGEMYEYIDDDEKDADTRPPAGFTSKPCRPVKITPETILASTQQTHYRQVAQILPATYKDDSGNVTSYMSVCRFNSVKGGLLTKWACSFKNPNCIEVKCSEDVRIHGVGLYGSTGPSRRDVQVKLLEDTGSVIADTGHLMVNCDGGVKPLHVVFQESVVIKRENLYTIEACIGGPFTYRGVDGKATVREAGCTFTFKKSSLDKVHNSVLYGQIPEILFSL